MYLTFRQGGPVLAPLRSNFGQIGLYVGQSIAPCRAASAWVPRVTPIPPEGPLRSARSHVRGADLRYRPLYAALDRDDAVLAIVERLNEPKLATLDRRHFGLLRPRHVDALLLLPD